MDEQGYNATRRREGGYLTMELDLASVDVLGGPALPPGARVTAFAFPQGPLAGPSWRVSALGDGSAGTAGLRAGMVMMRCFVHCS